jgi:hypothetical protein
MSEKFILMLERLVGKVSNMRPIPPCDNLFDSSWGKVDKLILKTVKIMKDKGVERPLHLFSEAIFDMAMKDVATNSDTSQALQAVAYRVMDTRLLVDEFGRMRQMAVAIRDVARGRKDVKIPSPHFPPKNPALIPPCFSVGDINVYDDSAVGVVNSFARELRERGILPAQKRE